MHTPGPWTVGSKSAYGTHNPNLIHAEQETIAMVYGIPHHTRLEDLTDRWETGLSNALLIAAAPLMLETLQACEIRLTHLAQNSVQVVEELKMVRSAIAAALGAKQ